MRNHSTVKKFAASTAVVGALSVAGLGLANGTAAAAPADDAGSASGSSSSSEPRPPQSSGAIPKPTTGGDDAEVHAHLVPGYTPDAATGTGNSAVPAHLIPESTPQPLTGAAAPEQNPPITGRYGTPDNPTCDSPGCVEIIDE